MTLRALLGKELRWGRRRLVALLLLLVLVPGLFAYSSLLFQDVIPRDAPVAVVAGDDATEEDVALATDTLELFAHPVRYESTDAAFRALDRERVYGVVLVPGGLAAEDDSPTVDLHVDGRIVPYREPSEAVATAVGATLDRNLPADVSVDYHVRGGERDLAEYLLPTFLVVLLAVLAFAYLPYNLAGETAALDRVRVESSLEALVGAKLLFFSGLALVPVAVFAAAAAYLDYRVAVLAPGAVAVYLATFLGLAGTSTAVTFATRFSTAGRLFNVFLLFALLAFSGLAYPAGFFSPVRREAVRLAPTHYAMVLVRNATLKGASPSTYPEAVAAVAGLAVAGLALAEGALVYYRRVT